MRVVPANVTGLSQIDLRAEQWGQDVRGLLEPAMDAALRECGDMVLADCGEPLCAFGLTPLWPGVAQAWGLMGQKAIQHPTPIARHVRRGLDRRIEAWGLWRVQATIQAGHEYGPRWMRFLGFRLEGRMERYGADGSDHDLYARIRHGS